MRVALIDGTLFPIRILAFSRLMTLTRGLANMSKSESTPLALRLDLPVVAEMLFARILAKSDNTALGESNVKSTLVGSAIPSSNKRLRVTSKTSNSNITSGSGWSCKAMILSIMVKASGLSRTISILSFSSTTISLDFKIVLSESATPLARALVNMKDLTTVCW